MRQMLEQPQQQRDVVEEFRKALEALPALTHPPEEEHDQKPLIFIIDELDRCKPVFALALLERIKHFMSVPNVHFVLGTHLEQLRNSVRYAYGSEIDATLYLQKFISLTIELDNLLDDKRENKIEKYSEFLQSVLIERESKNAEILYASEEISRLIKIKTPNLRSLERCFIILAIISAHTPQNRSFVGSLIGGLIVMKVLNPDLFRSAKYGTLDYQDATKFLSFRGPPNNPMQETTEERIWISILADKVPEHLNDFARRIPGLGRFEKRRDLLTYYANTIVDRISPDP
jgi:hypothetical protein